MCGSSATALAGVCLFYVSRKDCPSAACQLREKGCLRPWLLTPHEAGAVPLASAAARHPCRWGRTSPIEACQHRCQLIGRLCFHLPNPYPFGSRAPGLHLNIKGVVNPLRFFRLFLLKIRGHKPRKEQGQVLSDCSVYLDRFLSSINAVGPPRPRSIDLVQQFLLHINNSIPT